MDYSSRKKIFFTLIIPAAVLLVFFVQLYKYSNPIRFKVPSKKILFLTQKGLYDFNKPEPDKYGLSDMGMFGMFENFLQTIDIETSRTSVINNSVLSQSSLLIIINTTQELSVQEHKSLWQFVESGGGLLVLGDHTDMNGMMKPLNNILTPSGISFNFDSAMYLKKNWDDGYSCFYNPVFKGVRAHEEFNFSVGASLSVNSSARPVLEGRYGYSDTGDYNNAAKSFLGDYKFNPGEKYGNLILVAESRYEKGKVIVFGDTSTFQTFSLYSSEIFIRNIISYLTCKKINKALPPEKLIQADISHSEKFIRFNMGAESISPMIMAAYRRNMFFRFITSFDDLNKASLNIINAPVKKISGDEISKINSYLKDGGNVILSAGYDEYEACRDFLNGHKIKIESVPLGQTDSNGLDEDFIFSNVWALNPGDDSFEIIARVWDYPVIAMKNVGKGKLVIVADSRFFLSENMEEQSGYIRGNCNFTKKLYERIFERDKNPD